MAHMHGDYYIWTDCHDDSIHIWAYDGYDGWDLSGWACSVDEGSDPGRCQRRDGYEEASGTGVPEEIMDDFVLMRFAEILVEGRATEVLGRVVEKYGRPLMRECGVQLQEALSQIHLDAPEYLARRKEYEQWKMEQRGRSEFE